MRALIFLLVLGFVSVGLASAQTVNLFSIFEQTPVKDRLSWLESKPLNKLPDDFLYQALLLTDAANIELGSDDDVHAKTETALWLCQQLGSRHYVAAIPLLRRLPTEYHNTNLKSAVWAALAADQATAAIPDMILELKALNAGFTPNAAGEAEAYTLLQALTTLKAKAAFPDFVRATSAWYSPGSQVRALALKSLPLLVPDYSQALLSVIRTDTYPGTRLTALELAQKSTDVQFRDTAAAVALKASLDLQTNDDRQQDIVTRLRKAALTALAVAASVPAEALPSLKNVLMSWIDPQADFDDLGNAAFAMAKISAPDSVKALAQVLSQLNSRQKVGANTSAQVGFARVLIAALGVSASPLAAPALSDVEYSSYTPAIRREARSALKRIPQS
ncbi:MAG: hypothetical protein HKM05_01570 [Spirochaetales bacterium]|nr:hypothetical protein [Spirochaetales bacterium]